MKKLINKLTQKLTKKLVSNVTNDSDVDLQVPEVEPVTAPGDNSKKTIWRFIIQTLINILAAVLTALGATSCINHFM